MKQSTFSAVMANSIKNLLQGYTKGIRFVAVLTMLLIVGIGQVWGATAEFLPSHFSGQGTSGTGSAISATENGVTFACDKGYGTTQFRCYSGGKITISSSNTITAISFTFSGSYKGGLESSYTNLDTKSWEKDLSSQARITKCVVTYEEASTEPYTVKFYKTSTTFESVPEKSAGAGVNPPTMEEECGDWTFQGWSKLPSNSETSTTKLDLVITLDDGIYYPTADAELYPVYTKSEGGGGTAYTKVTTISEGVYVMVSEKTSGTYKYMPNTTSSGANPNLGSGITISTTSGITSLTNEVTDAMLWDFTSTETANQFYLRPHGSTTIGLGCTTSTGANIRISSTYKDVKWTITTSSSYGWQFKSNASSAMYLAVYSDSNWRNYTSSTTNQNGKFHLFKQTSSSTTYYYSYPQCATQTVVTLNPNEGTGGTTSVTATYEQPMPTITPPTLAGYDFQGYFTENGGAGTKYYKADGTSAKDWDKEDATFTLIAYWTPKTYTVTLDNQGATTAGATSVTATYNAAMPSIASNLPQKTGYTFNGYFDAASGGTQYYNADGTSAKNWDKTEATTLYAQWTSNKTTTSLSWSEDAYSATIDADNTFPELTKTPAELTGVTYSSSDPTVATIDENGNITLLKKGETTITATFEETPTHTGATASYTLTVHPSNCRWVEVTDNTTLEDGDKVVITMTKYGSNGLPYTYALPNAENTSSAPQATNVSTYIDGNELNYNENDADDFKWTVEKSESYYIFHPANNGTLNLYCNRDNDGVRVGSAPINAKSNHEFFILGNYLVNRITSRYVGVNITKGAWYSYEVNTGNISDQTLKFYKRECLDVTKVWVEGNLTNVTCTQTLPQQIAKNGSLTLNFASADGYALPDNVTVTNASKTWDKSTGTLTISNPTGNVMVTVSAVELHTITWMVGSNSVLTEEVANATGVTKTPDTPANGAIGNCANAFRGWSETSLGSAEGQSAPADLCTAAQMKSKHNSVTGDKTFYAVFATEEGGGAEVGTVIFSENFSSFNSGATMTGTKNSATGRTIYGDASVTYSYKNGSGAGTKIYNEYSAGGTSPELLVGKNSSTFTITGIPNGGASQLQLTYKQNAQSLTSSVSGDGYSGGTNANTKATTSTIITVGPANTFDLTFTGPSGNNNVRLDDIVITVYKGGATYSNYVTNCCALAPATNLTVSGTTSNTATLTWTAPSPATGITKLQVRNAETDEVVVNNIAVNTTTATIIELTECTSYQYHVVSVGEDCEVFSNTVTATPFSGAKTVNYDYNGGSGSPESFTTSCDDDKREIILPAATRPGYTFEGWYDSEENKVGDAGATYDPATSPITLYAHWTEITYQLNHSGSNYTITENKTTIKSSDTPFTLNYTCTGDYGFPSTITISGGGKSWTAGTDYVWTVAADKQSATLTINQTTISANVTITINMATRYTVSFEHNDKGVFDGESSIEVLSSENTITLPTVEDVSCGFYDTFEGWIISNDEYVESTTKPATVYAGGASYKVTGDCTFRALYSKCEGDATQVYRKVTSTGEVTDGTYILVANTSTPLVYSGHTDGKDYGDCISGLTADGSDFSSTLPAGTVPVTVAVGGPGFSIYNGTKFIVAGTSTGVSDDESYWQLTDGSQVKSKACPQGVLQPINNTTYVLQKNNTYDRFKTYENSQSAYVFLYKLIDKCTKYYSTNPSCEKPVGVHIVYHANAVDANMSCDTQHRTYKVENEVNKYPQLASQLQFCTNATREGYTLVGWNTQENGQGTTYNINQNYYNLPVSGELDDEKWITLNLYAMWKPCIKFNLGNATGGTGVPDAIVENGECVLPEPTAEQLGTIPCGYEFYAWSETSITPTQTKPALFMPGDTYTGSALTLYAVYRWCEGNTGSDTYYFTFIVDDKTYCITQKHNSYDRFMVSEQSTGLVFGLENGYLYYLDENGTKNYVYYAGSSTYVTTTTTYPNADTQKTTFVEGDNGTTIVTPAILGRYLQMPSSYTDRAYYTTDGINPTLVEVQTTTCTYATNPTCYTNTNLHFVTNGGTLNYPTDYDETNYLELTPGTTILMPTATFAGEWTFEGWKRGGQLESQTLKPDDPSFYPVTLNATQFEVDDVGDIYFYAVYSKTNDDKQFDPVNGGTYKLFAIGADDTKTYMPIWSGGRGTPSGVTTCAEAGDYTITPGTGTHAGQYQITCGEYTLGVVSGNTDLNKDEGTWWNIEPSTSGKGTWRITVAGSTDDRALSCSFSTAKSFGNYAISNLNNPSQSIYRDMEIGECIYTEYTSTPENIPYITITGAPVKITSTNGERVYASTTVHIEAHNFTGERIIHLSATNGFGVDPVEVRTNGQGAYSGNVKVYYEPTTDGDGQTITTSVLTASQKGGTDAEKISQTFAAIQGRNLPANFVIAAKWDGYWYALPANCTSSLSSTEGLLIEVDDVDNPTRATQAPASAKYGIREVIPSRQTDHGQGVVFTERYSNDNKEYSLYNNGTSANLQVYSQYSNYAAANPERYEWTPSTTDFVEYTLTNVNSSRKITLNNSGAFSATTASGQVRLLPATFYEPAPVQVLKWKANSVIVMYTGAEATATTQVGNNDASDKQTLADQKITHGIYELTTKQALTSNAGGALKLNFGANTRVELEIPLIISGEVTASANAHDVVILENSKLTAAATKYSYKDVYVYGGGKLAVPASTSLGVNNIILRAGGIATNGAGDDATYQYIYPQVELKGTLSSTKTDIKYEYVTDYVHWYHFVLPFNGNIKSITYPTEYYGDHVALDNTGSWVIKRYDGATRATGNYNAWVDIESEAATTTTAGKGYIFWGAPKKVSVNGGTKVRQQWGIQRITMPITSAATAVGAENGDKTIEGLSSYKDVANNSGAVNDQGWNLIGNPYLVNLTTMAEDGLKAGKLEKEIVDGNWTGKWFNNGDGIRYLTIPSNHFDTYEAKTVSAAITASNLVPGRAFFVQLEGEANGVTFAAANRASLMPQHLAAQNREVAVETGIILSNETMQDEMNFWIKDGKTNDYEYNADYPKTPNSTNFNIYGVHINGNLSWVATGPEYAEESMPIGYQVPAAGTYTLSISETYFSDLLDALFVTDHAMSPEVTVDLMSAPYEFSVNQAETNNERFTVSVILKSENQGPTTGLENTGVQRDGLTKFIYQDKMFILHNGIIYDATGKKVTTINK